MDWPGHRGILNTYAHDRSMFFPSICFEFFPWEEAEA